MNLLLDTHIFLWWSSQADKLPTNIREICEDPENRLFLSIASLWEIQIKAQLGKLSLRKPLKELVERQVETNDLEIITARPEHIYALQALPLHHKDPFDRMLIAQAQVERLTLVTIDSAFSAYSARCFP